MPIQTLNVSKNKVAQDAAQKKTSDTHTISSGLRLVGDYLDQKGAVTFNIQWSIESVRVRFEAASGDPKETSFTMQNLKDLAVVMYLRRSRR